MGPVHNPCFTPPDRRFKVMPISPEFLFSCLFNRISTSKGIYCIEVRLDGETFPEDMKIEAILYDPMDRLFKVRLWSSTFPEIKEGTRYTESTVEIIAQYM